MSSSPALGDRPVSRLATVFSLLMGAVTVALGATVLLFGVIAPQAPWFSGGAADAAPGLCGPAGTALCLILLGGGAICVVTGRRSGLVLPVLAAIAVLATTIDQRCLTGGRPAPTAVAAFLLLAAAQLVRLAVRRGWAVVAGQAAAIVAGVIGMLALYGQLYHAPALAGVPGYRGLSLGAAVAVVTATAATLPGDRGTGLVWVLTDHTASATLTRRMLAVALLVLPAAAWLLVRGEEAGLYDERLEAALLVAVNVGLVTAIVLTTGSRAARAEAASATARLDARRHAHLDTILRNTPIAFFMKDIHGRYELASAAFEELYGPVTGRLDREVHSPERYAEVVRREQEVLAADGPMVFEHELPGEHGVRTFVTTVFAVREHDGSPYSFCGVSTDITQLRVAERKFKALLDASPEAMVCVDAQGRILLANSRAVQVFRYAPEQLVGMAVEDLIPEPVRESHVRHRDHYLAAPVPRAMGEGLRLIALRGDGTECPVEISLAAVDGEGGTIVFATVQDVTERLAQEQSDAQLAGIVAASSDAIVSKTLDGTILTWNPGAERLYGYTAAEMIGNDVTVILPPDRPDEERGLLARVNAGELIKHHETRRVRQDGTTIYVSLSMAPVRDPAGVIVGASTISHDITAEVEAERRLRFEREQFQTIMTAASDPFISMDFRGLITEWNRQAEQVFGWRREQVLGRHVVDTMLPRRYRAALDRVLEGRWEWLLDRPTELTAVRADGTELPIELTMWRIRRDGPSTFHAFARDITARRQTEQALEQARDQAVETAHLKSQFLASMSHEIRTPMNGVIGLSGLLLGTDLGQTQRRYAQGINSAGVALLSVINDVLDFSKLEAGKVVLERANFEIWRLLDDVVGLVADATRTKELTVAARCDPALAAMVSGDAGKLRQVLLNLAGNAVKFTSRGHVSVTASPAPAGDFPAGSIPVRFEVLDTGIGIDGDQQTGLFEPFTQADAGTTRRFGGTGLGLAISRELVGVLGGEIGLSSEAGKGSTFWFTVPLLPPIDGAETPSRQTLDGLRVLLIAGEEGVSLSDQLAGWTIDTTVAANASEAMGALAEAALAGRPYDVAIFDGEPQLTAEVVADPNVPTPKMVLVGDEPSLPPARARSAGFNAVLTRPVRQSQLYDVLVGVFAGPAEDRALRTTAESPSGRGHVLLVEDNEINQTVALGILANLGYSADVAANGRQAVEMATGQYYQAIFMDCLMPEMDGYEATAEIRRSEAGEAHVPIIAMTAGAMPEDRERCLAAGMDDHIAKPLMPADLAAALGKWTLPPAPELLSGGVREQIRERLDLLRSAGGALGPNELAGLLRRLSAHAPGHVEAIVQAVATDDAVRLREQAHQFKGVAANLGARDLAELCDRLESHGRHGEVEAAVEALAELRPRARELLSAIGELTSELDRDAQAAVTGTRTTASKR
jgi:PAS domain S-box-containing protein